MPSQRHESLRRDVDVRIRLLNMVRPGWRPEKQMGLVYLDGIEDFDDTGMAQGPQFLQRVSCEWEARAVGGYVEREDATPGPVLLVGS